MTPWSEYSKTCGAKVKNGMTAEELKVKRLALGFRSLHALLKALGVNKYAIEHWESLLYLEGMLRQTPATDENLYIGHILATWPQWI